MDATAPRGPAPGITAPRYCSRCGTPLAETSSGCTRCDRLFRLREEAVEPPNLHARSLWSALGLYFVLLGASVALIASEWVLGAFDLHSSTATVVEWIVQGVDSVVVLAWVVAEWKIVRPMVTAAGSAWWYVAAVLTAGLTFMIASLAMHGATNLLGIEEYSYLQPLQEQGLGLGAAVLTVAAQPAIIEELAFRGVIMASLTRIMSPAQAVAVSALLFMVLHLSPLSFPHLLLLGLVLGSMRVLSGSIYPCMLLHFVHNLLCIIEDQHPMF